jgi:hypothetical protein
MSLIQKYPESDNKNIIINDNLENKNKINNYDTDININSNITLNNEFNYKITFEKLQELQMNLQKYSTLKEICN